MLFDSTLAINNTPGLKTQTAAMQACGMQPEFASQLLLQCNGMGGICIILRAGNPPVYNQKRSPKSGINLSKTSNQGFFKGSIAENILFTRVYYNPKMGFNEVIGHHPNDIEALMLSPQSEGYQHRVQLTITMLDLIRELGSSGDLQVIDYNANLQQLRLKYKENKGCNDFKGQFVLDFNEKKTAPLQFYSRPWDIPQNNPEWDNVEQIIKKPVALNALPDERYQLFFGANLKVYYTDELIENPKESDLKQAKVFASTPKTADDFLQAMGAWHPKYLDIANCIHLSDILKKLTPEEILTIYDQSSLIITGDWDGLALGHPPNLPQAYKKIHNTFNTKNSFDEMISLLNATMDYLSFLKKNAEKKEIGQRNVFDELILDIKDPNTLISNFALQHAGCITAHEFLFQQILNYNYRLESNKYYGEKNLLAGLQRAIDEALEHFLNEEIIVPDMMNTWLIANYHNNILTEYPNPAVLAVWDNHLQKHFQQALALGKKKYTIPHPAYDHNIQDLFQHGFDVNNPYGCNFAGAWFMIAPDGNLIYGETQEQLIEVMLTDGFLENNLIDINFAASLASGWDKVIEKQLALGQTIPEKTQVAYNEYQEQKKTNIITEKKETILDRAKELFPFFKKKSDSSSNQDSDLFYKPPGKE